MIKKKVKEKTTGNPSKNAGQLKRQRSKLNLDPTLKLRSFNYAKASESTEFERSFSNLKITINPLHFLLQKKLFRDKIDKFFQSSPNYISSHISFNLRSSPSLLISKSFPVAKKKKKKKEKSLRTYPAPDGRMPCSPSISIHHSPNLSEKFIHENALLSPKSARNHLSDDVDSPLSLNYSSSSPVSERKTMMNLTKTLSRSQTIVSESSNSQFSRVKPAKTVSFRVKKDVVRSNRD